MNFKTIFIAGSHGVGKGHLSEYLIRELAYPSFSASALIKKEKDRPVDSQKIAIDAAENQDFLIIAMKRIVTKSEVVFVDGHFSLRINNGFFDIPKDTFQNMNLYAIILKIADKEIIKSRLIQRDGECLSIDIIEELQIREVNAANSVANSLDIPLFLLEDDNYENVVAWLKNLSNIK
jgi:adenylate kinase